MQPKNVYAVRVYREGREPLWLTRGSSRTPGKTPFLYSRRSDAEKVAEVWRRPRYPHPDRQTTEVVEFQLVEVTND
jgi:hypothetical protein